VRAFVAVEVEDRPVPAGANDRDRPPVHLTLHFLGEIAEDRVESIAAALRNAVAPLAPFDVTLEGVGAFPSHDAPRVVWVGTTAGTAALIELAHHVTGALSELGFASEAAEFVPHVTLFRVRSARDRHRARALLDGSEAAPAPRTVHVAEVLLKESTLTRTGPVHRTVGCFPLRGPVVGAG
jgi:RNA 2',3'-cyclic 3'-phosphodiesterase